MTLPRAPVTVLTTCPPSCSLPAAAAFLPAGGGSDAGGSDTGGSDAFWSSGWDGGADALCASASSALPHNARADDALC